MQAAPPWSRPDFHPSSSNIGWNLLNNYICDQMYLNLLLMVFFPHPLLEDSAFTPDPLQNLLVYSLPFTFSFLSTATLGAWLQNGPDSNNCYTDSSQTSINSGVICTPICTGLVNPVQTPMWTHRFWFKSGLLLFSLNLWLMDLN